MQFPSRDFTNQFISSSYQDVLQQYRNTSSLVYVLDGYGNVVFSIESASVGGIIPVGTPISCSWASMSMNAEAADFALLAGEAITAASASYAFGCDFALLAGDAISSTSSSYALSASWAPGISGGGGLETGSTYPFTSSVATTASYWDSSSIETTLSKKQWVISTGSTLPITASVSITASYAKSSSISDISSYADNAGVASTAGYASGADMADKAISLLTSETSVDADRYLTFSELPFIPFSLYFPALVNANIKVNPSKSNISCSSVTASLKGNVSGTSSFAISSSWAPSSGPTISASYAESSSHAQFAITAAFALTSAASGSVESASYATTASYAVTASYALNGGGGGFPAYNTASVTYDGPINQLGTASYWNGVSLVAQIVYIYAGNTLTSSYRTV